MHRSTILLLGLVCLALAAEPSADRARFNLAGKPAAPRFALTDRVWPVQPGEASVCLWSGDAFAAYSVSIDDNCAGDVPWWPSKRRRTACH